MVLFIISGEKMKEKYHDIETSVLQDEQDNDAKYEQNEHSSDLIKAMEILQSSKNIEGTTILNNIQVNALTMMNWASQVFDIEFFKHYVSLFPRYRISGDDGRGRKDLIQIAEAIRREKEEDHDRFMEILGRRG